MGIKRIDLFKGLTRFYQIIRYGFIQPEVSAKFHKKYRNINSCKNVDEADKVTQISL